MRYHFKVTNLLIIGIVLAWFPVQIKNGVIKSVGKPRWRKRRKCKYIEETDCFKTGKPKRIYNAQEDQDDPEAGTGEDNGETAYDDYDYYEGDDDENSPSNADSNEHESSVTSLKGTTAIDVVADVSPTNVYSVPTTNVNNVSPINVNDLRPIFEDNLPPRYTTENPLTDETEEQTERKVRVNYRGPCKYRHHTYQDHNSDTTPFQYPIKTSTYKFQKSSYKEQSSKTTSNATTTVIKIKYYTDDYYDEEVTKKTTEEANIINSTIHHIFSTTAEIPEVMTDTEISEKYGYSTKKIIKSTTAHFASSTAETPEVEPDTEISKKYEYSTKKIIKSTTAHFASSTAETPEVEPVTDVSESHIVSTTAETPETLPITHISQKYGQSTLKKIKSTIDHVVSTTEKIHKVHPVTDISEEHKHSTIKSSSSTSIRMTESEDEGPETYHSESKPEEVDRLSSLEDSNTFTGTGSVPHQRKTSHTVHVHHSSSTHHHGHHREHYNFTKHRTPSVTQAIECGDDYYSVDVPDNSKNCEYTIKSFCGGEARTQETRLRHIETPPYPKLPVDLRFPTCCNEDPLDEMLYPTCAPTKTSESDYAETSQLLSEQDSEKTFEKKKEKSRKNRKHCRRKSTHQDYHQEITTEIKSSQSPSSLITEHYVANKHTGNKKDAKVVVRIPPSLADIPVVVVKDPLTQKLSLSLIGAEQDSVPPKSIYYKQPLYRQMFPLPFSYNNLYSPNIPPFNKIYPYEYMYAPNVGYRYDKANYIYPKRHRFFNNYRWVRDTYEDDDEDDEEEDKNSTNAEWEIYITV